MTSHDVVNRLRKITGERSIGHLGTLDPMATGVLPLLFGKFTRLAQYFSSAEKSYVGTIRFGFATDTYDAEGKPSAPLSPSVIVSPSVPDLPSTPDLSGGMESVPQPALSLDHLKHLAKKFHGESQQMPPPYSAKKIAGQPAYKLAREGKPVELKPARVFIDEFEILSLEANEASFRMSISAGGYVRSVAHEMGQLVGCGAHLSRLERTRAGAFTLQNSHQLADLETLAGNVEELEALCIHPRNLLPEMPAVTADPQVLGRLRNGAQANLPEFSKAPLVKVFASQNELAGIAKRIAGTLFQPVVVMM